MYNITIAGAGAIGMVYASSFYNRGMNPRIAVDPSRRKRYLGDGLFLNSIRYDFDLYTPTESDIKADLIIIAVKSYNLNEAIELIRPVVGPNTQILPLLNGITSEEICAAEFGWHRVLYGYFIGHTATRLGNQTHQDGRYRTYFGEAINDAISDRVASIQKIFDQAEIPYKTPIDMTSSLWQKYIINIGMNQATAILQRTYGYLQQNDKARKYMISLMNEAASIARAMNITESDHMVEKAISLLDTLNAEDGSSMYQDVMSGRVTEVGIFAETICSLGALYGIETPYNFHAGIILRALEADSKLA